MTETKPIQAICVYCGSADGVRSEYYDAARQLGAEIAKAGLRLVYGAGKTGLMGAVADGALDAGGQVTGVIPTYLNLPHLTHARLTSLEIVANIHQRKARMSELAGAFIALPGGFGTFEELFETLTWAQIGLHQKPIGLVNTLNYFDPLIHLIEHALTEKFIYDEHRMLLSSDADPGNLMAKLLRNENGPISDKWITR